MKTNVVEFINKCVNSGAKVKPLVCVHVSAEAPVALLDGWSVVMTAWRDMNRGRRN